MEVIFLDVGEACDAEHGNTSLLVIVAGKCILLDCGFSVPHRFFVDQNDPERPDIVWISHFHGDHYFGMPLLLLRLAEMGRTSPLTIVSQPDGQEKIHRLFELAYPGFIKKLGYSLDFQELEPGSPLAFAGLIWHGMETLHSQRNLGLLLTADDKKFYYSGDGRPTDQIVVSLQQCDLVVHEAFRLVDDIPNHGSVNGCLELARKAQVRRLALVHLERSCRKDSAAAIREMLKAFPVAFLPENGHRIAL